MDNKLYKMMNWPEIESVIYSECDHPHEILGKHSAHGGSLIQCYFPEAKKVFINIKESGIKFEMQLADEEGFFAYWTNEKDIPDYDYIVEYNDGSTKIIPECYNLYNKLEKAVLDKFNAGILYDMYSYFGAHETEIKGVRGISFTVFAPGASRVSVVGDFNNWDGRISQMMKTTDNGIFVLFVPSLTPGSLYKYEIKIPSGLTFLKRDPFAFDMEKGKGTACAVPSNDYFSWSDTKYLASIKGLNTREKPIVFGEASLKDFYDEKASDSVFAEKIVSYAKSKQISAIIIDNLSVYTDKECTNEGVLSLFSVNEESIPAVAVKKAVNVLHENNIPIIFTIDLSSFLPDNEGLIGFSGCKMYESFDDRKIEELISFDFGNPYVRNYLISAAFYYIKSFHADGLVLKGIDRILYLNYGHIDGDYTPNIYGGPENLGGEELLKHLNSILHKKEPEIVTIAADSLYSNSLTKMLDENGIGFDFKISNNFHKAITSYMVNEPYERSMHYSDLTNISLNAYCEEFVLSLPQKSFGTDEFTLCEIIPGDYEEKIKEIKLILATLFLTPNKKSIPFYDFKEPGLDELLKELTNMYYNEKSLYEFDNSPNGFEWLDAVDSEHSTISFIRKGIKEELICIGNFSGESTEVAVKLPESSRYMEIFDSEEIRFGGKHTLSEKVIKTVVGRSDKKNTLRIKLPALSYKVLKKLT